MKNVFKLMVITAAVGLSVFFGSADVKAAEVNSLVTIDEAQVTTVSEAEFEKLDKGATASNMKALAKEFQKHMIKREKTFTVTYNGGNPDPSSVLYAVGEIDDKKTSDDADFLAGGVLSIGWSGYTTGSQTVLNCKIVYTENANQVKKVNSQSKKILKKLKVSKMSDVAKTKVIHDYVVKLVTYDDTLKDHSAYGGLAASKHTTVCQGYALIMYKLLTDAGVPCHYVTGNAGEPHAWNIVKIKGKWYYLDATWDDPSNTLVYDYFLVGSKTLKKDHSTDSYYTKKYKVSSADLNWKKLIKNSKNKDDSKVKTDQTKDEIAAGEIASAKAEFINSLSEVLKQSLNEDPDADDYMVAMYDLCAKIYGFIIEDMSEEAFLALLESDEMMNVYIEDTMDCVSTYILEPMAEYLNRDDFMNEIYEQMYADFGEEAFEGLSDEEMESLIEAYVYESFTAVLYYQSEEYTESIVDAMVQTLESMV